jgi:hypothetical protein
MRSLNLTIIYNIFSFNREIAYSVHPKFNVNGTLKNDRIFGADLLILLNHFSYIVDFLK